MNANICIGEIPPRTRVTVQLRISISSSDDADEAEVLEKVYSCLDCGFTTLDLRAMMKHQDNQSQTHTFWQRLLRRFAKK